MQIYKIRNSNRDSRMFNHFTACDVNTDKKVEKQANKVVDAVESKDITKLDAIINGTDEIKADEELKDFFETDTETNQKMD